MDDLSRYAIAGIILCLMGVGIYLFPTQLKQLIPGAAVGDVQLMYPLKSSVCCEEVGTNAWVNAITPLSYSAHTFPCPTGTTSCKFEAPVLNCQGGAWFGYEKVWKIEQFQNNQLIHTYCNNERVGTSGCETLPTGMSISFKPGQDYITYKGGCLENNILNNGIDDAISKVTVPALVSTSYFIEYVDTHLVRYPAGEGKHQIDGTPLCIQNPEVRNYAGYTPSDTNTLDQILTATSQLLGITTSTGQESKTQGYLADASTSQLKSGYCYTAVDRWEAIPTYLNVGKYNGQDVICSQDSGLFSLTVTQTEGGTRYAVPFNRIRAPSKSNPGELCCSNQFCQNLFGVNYECRNYICQPGPGSCQSDIDCQTGAETCYASGANYYIRASKCVSGSCVNVDSPVKCCDSSCTPQGYYCNYAIGCIPSVCTYHSGKTCSGDDIYWVDSCGNLQDVVQHCGGGCDKETVSCKTAPSCDWWEIWCGAGGVGGLNEKFATTLLGLVIGGMLGLILGTTIPGIGNVLGGVFGAIIGALIGFFGGVVLVALKPFVAVLGLIVGGVYTYELLGRIENNGVRLLIAAILGILTAYMVYMSFVYGIIMLVLFLILKTIARR